MKCQQKCSECKSSSVDVFNCYISFVHSPKKYCRKQARCETFSFPHFISIEKFDPFILHSYLCLVNEITMALFDDDVNCAIHHHAQRIYYAYGMAVLMCSNVYENDEI